MRINERSKINKNDFSYTIEVNSRETLSWNNIREDVLRIEKHHFGDEAFTEAEFLHYLEHPECVIVTIKNSSGHIIGYTFTRPTIDAYLDDWHSERLPEVRGLDGKSAYMEDIAIDPNFIGKGLAPKMVRKLEQALVERGYSYLEEDAAVVNGYAGMVEKTYRANGRLVYAEAEPHESKYGLQRFFRLRLISPK